MAVDFISSVGRRKEAIARVRLVAGKGPLTVNGKPIHEYFKGVIAQKNYQAPFELVSLLGQYSGTIRVLGGGVSSQLGAVVHGISRSLSKIDEEKRLILKRAGFLTRDSRVKERRKYGRAGKARALKQSPKR